MSISPSGTVESNDDGKDALDREHDAGQGRLQLSPHDLLSASLTDYSASFRVICRRCYSLQMYVSRIHRSRDNHRLRWRMACRACKHPTFIVTIEEAPDA